MNESIIFSLIGAVTGISGMILGFWGLIHSKNEAVNNYFSVMESKEFSNARRFVYNNDLSLEDEDASQNASYVVNFYHHWGLLVKKGYLPIWVFDSGSGAGTIRMYELTKCYIQEVRDKHHDCTYAEYFEWLYNEIKKRQEKARRRLTST